MSIDAYLSLSFKDHVFVLRFEKEMQNEAQIGQHKISLIQIVKEAYCILHFEVLTIKDFAAQALADLDISQSLGHPAHWHLRQDSVKEKPFAGWRHRVLDWEPKSVKVHSRMDQLRLGQGHAQVNQGPGQVGHAQASQDVPAHLAALFHPVEILCPKLG